MKKSTLSTVLTPKNALDALYERFGSWQKAANSLPEKFTRAYLRDVSIGRRPASARLCHALGCAESAKLVEPCANCGKVHDTVKQCHYRRKSPAPKPYKWMTDTNGKRWKVYLQAAGDVI